MEANMSLKWKIFIAIQISIVSINLVNAQTTKLSCKTNEGNYWGTLTIDLKNKFILDDNLLMQLSFREIENFEREYSEKKGNEYIPKTYNPEKNGRKFTITKVTDQVILGEEKGAWKNPKNIEINRYTLRMHYPPDTRIGWMFNCTKVEKAF